MQIVDREARIGVVFTPIFVQINLKQMVSMKITLGLSVLLLFISTVLYAQKKTIRSAIEIKWTPIPFLFQTGVGGNLEIDQKSLSFTPNPCREEDKKYSSIFPCNNHLIKNINLNFSEIAKIKRHNFLFVIPNRIFVKATNGDAYLFVTFKRRYIINTYKKYKSENALTNLK